MLKNKPNKISFEKKKLFENSQHITLSTTGRNGNVSIGFVSKIFNTWKIYVKKKKKFISFTKKEKIIAFYVSGMYCRMQLKHMFLVK